MELHRRTQEQTVIVRTMLSDRIGHLHEVGDVALFANDLSSYRAGRSSPRQTVCMWGKLSVAIQCSRRAIVVVRHVSREKTVLDAILGKDYTRYGGEGGRQAIPMKITRAAIGHEYRWAKPRQDQ